MLRSESEAAAHEQWLMLPAEIFVASSRCPRVIMANFVPLSDEIRSNGKKEDPSGDEKSVGGASPVAGGKLQTQRFESSTFSVFPQKP